MPLSLARFRALPLRLRLVGGASIAAVVFIVTAALLFARPARVPLFAAPLRAEQLGEVEQQLAAWNMSFLPSTDNVSVDAAARNGLLLRLSMAGVPHAHVDTSGDVLAKVGALTPQSIVDAQTRDGLAGDIALALRGVDGVQDATVIIAPAKTATFADEGASEATASVRLHLADGSHLSEETIAGIRAFVAASVQGLVSRNVTIMDDRALRSTARRRATAPPCSVRCKARWILRSARAVRSCASMWNTIAVP